MRSFLREVLITIVLALIIFFGARLIVQTYVVLQTSMEPNFHQDELVLVNKAIYHFDEPQRGDVVIFKDPIGESEQFIKRIIGLPHDTVEVKDGAVYVNDVRLNEPYIASPPRYTMAKETIPEDNYFVLGDNRNISNDSHFGWLMPRQNIIGKAWLITWPPADWGVVPNYHLLKQLAAAGA
jgi:signal peptidase I